MQSTRRCSINECNRKYYGRGWCKTHYNYYARHLATEDLTGRKCDICEKPHYAKGFCRKHWERNHLHGSPAPTRVLQGATVAERLAHHSERTGDCLEWTGRRDKDGYGQIQIDGRPERAHRVSYETHRGEIPPGMLLRHTCDNPPCINPDHLIPGYEADNSRDMVTRGRSLQGTRNHQAKLTPDEVLEIRSLADAGVPKREIARRFRLANSHVGRIVHRESWRAL